MMKTPMWGNALLILNVHLEHDTLKLLKNIVRFSLDISALCTYCRARTVNLIPWCALPQCRREYYS